jgi:hypothetical protein
MHPLPGLKVYRMRLVVRAKIEKQALLKMVLVHDCLMETRHFKIFHLGRSAFLFSATPKVSR